MQIEASVTFADPLRCVRTAVSTQNASCQTDVEAREMLRHSFDTFIPIRGTKRLFVQKQASDMEIQKAVEDVVVTFKVMEIDKLSE